MYLLYVYVCVYVHVFVNYSLGLRTRSCMGKNGEAVLPNNDRLLEGQEMDWRKRMEG